MAADVSYLVRAMSGYKDDRTAGNEGGDGRSTALITRDLLGCGLLKNESQELDLDLQVPNGWEKLLDLKSGKVYLQRCSSSKSPSSSSSSDHKHQNRTNQTVLPNLQDLNFPPSPSKLPLNLFDEGSLDLKLVPSSPPAKLSSSSSSRNSFYQSVCTLDKVKSALERAEKVEPNKKRSSLFKSSASSPSYSSSSSSIRETPEEDPDDGKLVSSSPIAAAGCPGCLSYILIMKSNPKCPRCNSVVPLPLMKKPKIDLNISI